MKASTFRAITAFCLAMIFGVVSRTYANSIAIADAGGYVAEVASGDSRDGVTAASIEVFSDPIQAGAGSYHAFSYVNGTTLRAYALAQQVDMDIGVQGHAEATWIDVLTLANPDILLSYPTPQDVYVFFNPRANGTGHNASGSFSASVTDRGDPVGDSKSVEFGLDVSPGTLSLGFKGPASSLVDGVTFAMDLRVAVSLRTAGDTGEADYSHTATLPPIFIGDINGNPIPELAGLQIVGSSGLSYPVTVTVPEPSSGVLAALGIVGLVAWGKRRQNRTK